MRILRFLFFTVAFAAVVWFGASVPLGKHTLFGHLHAIFTTPEAKELARGAGEEAKRVAERVGREIREGDDTPPARRERVTPARDDTVTTAPAPADDVDDEQQRELRRLIRERATKYRKEGKHQR